MKTNVCFWARTPPLKISFVFVRFFTDPLPPSGRTYFLNGPLLHHRIDDALCIRSVIVSNSSQGILVPLHICSQWFHLFHVLPYHWFYIVQICAIWLLITFRTKMCEWGFIWTVSVICHSCWWRRRGGGGMLATSLFPGHGHALLQNRFHPPHLEWTANNRSPSPCTPDGLYQSHQGPFCAP